MARASSYRVAPLGPKRPPSIPARSDSISSIEHPSSDGEEKKQGNVGWNKIMGQPVKHVNEHGVHWIICGILIVGEMAGGGLVALPNSFVHAGLVGGILLTILSALASGYTGIQLGDNWIMMQERWPEYRSHCRKPYPEMAYRSLGPTGRSFVSVLIAVQQFGLGVVFIILASSNISNILVAVEVHLHMCYIILIVAAFVLPFLMFESVKDFWVAGVIAAISTSCAIVLIFIGISHDRSSCEAASEWPTIQADEFFLAYGTIMFAYGGHSCFPTFQHDMKKPYHFKRSVILGYIIIVLMYLPVSVFGYYVYGGALDSSIIQNLQLHWVQQVVNGLITVHVFFTLMIILAPLSLEIEDTLGMQRRFSIRRVGVRTLMLAAIVFVALSLPKFGPILDIVGGTTITLMTMLLPGIFYLSIVAGKRKREIKIRNGDIAPTEADVEYPTFTEVFKYNKLWIVLLNCVVLLCGLVGGVAATYSAVVSIIHAGVDTPCYVKVFQGALGGGQISSTTCCGPYLNISTIPDGVCAMK